MNLQQSAPGNLVHSKSYLNADYPNFLSLVIEFLGEAILPTAPVAACFAVAGHVKHNRATLTNRKSWTIDGNELQKELAIGSVLVINDFLAVGYGLLTLEDTECRIIQHGHRDLSCPIACIGAGTGLGQCYLTRNTCDGSYSCFPSEGGHADYSPQDLLEVGLIEFLKEKLNLQHRVSVERVISGSGLVNIYEYLSLIHPGDVDHEIQAKIESAGDMKGAVIAGNQENVICEQTMSIFLRAYGAETGDACLKWLPYGGIYLTGGLTPKNIDRIADPTGPFFSA